MITSLRRYFKNNYIKWLDKRLQARPSIVLTQKRIFIFPSKVGLLFFLLIALMFVTSINYQNNLLFNFSCLLISIFVSAIAFTYKNLSGLKIQAGVCDAVYAGQKANVNIEFDNDSGQAKQGICIGFDHEERFQLDSIDGKLKSSLACIAEKRGWLEPPRFHLLSYYPLGLLRCWTWVKLDFDLIVYPQPIHIPFRASASELGEEDDEVDESKSEVKGQTNDDFYGFKNYQAGDSLKHVAWRHYAKTSQLYTKEFSSQLGSNRWLDWDALEGLDYEKRLQILCGWVLDADKQQIEYGLRLPEAFVDVNWGEQHKHACLETLALYGLEKNRRSNDAS